MNNMRYLGHRKLNCGNFFPEISKIIYTNIKTNKCNNIPQFINNTIQQNISTFIFNLKFLNTIKFKNFKPYFLVVDLENEIRSY